MHRLLLVAAIGSSLVLAPPSASIATAQDASSDGSDQEARALFSAGQVAFEQGRYESSLEYFQRAYDLSHRPLLLYNIGSAAEHLRLDQRALDAYRGYVAAVPDAANRAAVEARIAVLEHAMTTTTTTTTTSEPTTTTATTTPTSTATSTPTRIEPPQGTPADSGGGGPGVVPWVIVGVGAAAAIAGAVLVGVGMADAGNVTGAAQGSHWSDVSGAYSDAPVLTGAGWACLGVGVAAVIGGVIWGVAGGSSDAPRATASVWMDGSSGGVAVMGSF